MQCFMFWSTMNIKKYGKCIKQLLEQKIAHQYTFLNNSLCIQDTRFLYLYILFITCNH